MTRPDIRNAPDLVLNVLRQFSDLLRSEAELAKSELKEKASNAR
ncbi:phage holin family protein, partial [Rhodobacteraceae bacterium R_SAG2]|nr:phage holin family protein [Rhodobacteraceae bacterium R_SAG2]